MIKLNNDIQIYGTNGLGGLYSVEFMNENNTFSGKCSFRIKKSADDVFDTIIAGIGCEVLRFNSFQDSFYIKGYDIFISAYYDTFGKKKDDAGYYNINIFSPNRDRVKEVVDHLEKAFEGLTVNSVVWAILAPNGEIIYKEMQLSNDATVAHDSFYPWLNGISLKDYYTNYINSDENVLLLTGVPGTGKTTFIRNFLVHSKMNSVITYDEKLMKDDNFFLDFISEDKDILIIEDADTMILDREESDNNLMSKILNVSDGLIKNIKKKIIFSTNITDISRIDSALMRPGRCYDVLNFRKLHYDESLAVLKDVGINKELVTSNEYSLAELTTNGNRTQPAKAKFGFN